MVQLSTSLSPTRASSFFCFIKVLYKTQPQQGQQDQPNLVSPTNKFQSLMLRKINSRYFSNDSVQEDSFNDGKILLVIPSSKLDATKLSQFISPESWIMWFWRESTIWKRFYLTRRRL